MAISVQQLFRAIQASDFEAAKRAFNLNPSLVHAKHPRDSHTPLHAAAALGNLQLLRDLLHQGASCQALDCNNETPLHVASRQGHAAVVRELLTDAGRRSCVKSNNRDGATPLHLAVVAGHADVVQALVNAGARTDARDRAGRTPQDLVSPSQPLLADILTQGRQLTPASAGRTMRRTGSPTLSPQPRRASSRASSGGMRSGPVSPSSCAIRDAAGRAADSKRRASSRAASADGASKRASASNVLLSPTSKATSAAAAAEAAAPDALAPAAESSSGSGASRPGYDLYCHPDHNEQYDQQGRLLPDSTAEPAAAEEQPQQPQQHEMASNQAWQHYSPQKSLDAAFMQAQQQQQQEPANLPQQMQQQAQPAAYHQTYQVEPQSAQLRSSEPVRPENSGLQPSHVKLHSPAGHHALPGGPFNAGPHPGAATPASSGAQGAFGMHYQQRQPQQAPQPPPSQLGPLRSARAAGPLAASAAAMAAVNDLARSFDYHPPTAHGMAPGGAAAAAAHTSSNLSAGGLRQQLSHGGIMAATGSYIVSPEASSGLLQGSAAAGSAAHTHQQQPGTAAAASSQAAAQGPAQQPEHAAAAAPAQPEAVGPLSAGASLIYGQPSRRSLSMVPGSSSMGPSATANPGAAMGHSNALPPCPPNLAALAAAVSANSRVGPLSQPLQAQLNDLAAKVGQLEAWFEAQVELIPEWQKVLGVVQGIKRQLEEQQARQEEAEDALHSQQLTGLSLAAQVTALERARAADAEVLACVPQHTTELEEVQQEHASLKASLAEFGEQVRQLQAQMVHTASAEAARNAADECQMRSLAAALSANSARLATLEESQLAPLSSSMAANSSRVAALEAGLEELRGQLAAQQQQQESNCEAADGGNAAPEERLAALEASLAELQLSMAHMHGTAPSEAGSELRTSASARAVASAAAAASAAAGKQGSSGIALLEVQSELGELRARVADLSACLAGAGGGAVEEAFLPFMETTSNCLQQHEQQLDTIQALVPKLESVVAQRAQMCELMQQVAALQTAFNLLTGAKPTPSKEAARPNPSMLASGPMVSHKAAADYLAMATSMVKLQGQMGGLAAAVEALQEEWGATEERLTTQQDAVKSAWEAERSRLAAAEREAVRRMADQQRELRVREERLTQIREAALAEEAARRSQLDSEARVNSALAGMSGQQQQLQGRLAGLADTTEALQEQLATLQAEVESSLVNLGPHISAMMAAQEASEQQQHASTAAAAQAAAAARAPSPQEISAMLSSLDATNPIHEPEPEDTPQAPNPFAGDSSKGASPRPAGPTQRMSSRSIGWQQQQPGEVHTSTALAYAEVTGGVCHVNLLPVPAAAMRSADAQPAAAGTAAAPGMLPSSVSSALPAAPVAAKKAGWFSRTLGSHGKAARHQHRYAAVPSQQQQADEDVALLDQATAMALSDTEQDVGGDAASPERRAKSGSRIADQALLRAGAAAGSSQCKHAGSSSSKWKKPWHKLGFGGKSSGSAAAVAGADVRPLRG